MSLAHAFDDSKALKSYKKLFKQKKQTPLLCPRESVSLHIRNNKRFHFMSEQEKTIAFEESHTFIVLLWKFKL
jgi:hypothetical protein